MTMTSVTLQNLVQLSFPVMPHEVVGLPAWTDTVRFDIGATLPSGATRSDVSPMIRSLLIERFGLRSHVETREVPVYHLVVAKNGAKMPSVNNSGSLTGTEMVTARGWSTQGLQISMANFARELGDKLQARVIDTTGLPGLYEISAEYSTPDQELKPGIGEPAFPSVFTVLQDRLGLKLEQTKGSVEIVVIDHIERLPTDN